MARLPGQPFNRISSQENINSFVSDNKVQHNERHINIFGQEWILSGNREYLIEHENGSAILKESGNILAVHNLAPSETVIISEPAVFEETVPEVAHYIEATPYNDDDYAPTYRGQEAELLQKELELKAELEMQTKLKEAYTSIETYNQDKYTPQIKGLKNILRNIRTNSAQTSLKP